MGLGLGLGLGFGLGLGLWLGLGLPSASTKLVRPCITRWLLTIRHSPGCSSVRNTSSSLLIIATSAHLGAGGQR